MRFLLKALGVLVAALGADWLHNTLYHWAWDAFGASYALGDLWEIQLYYGFLYLLCFAGVAAFSYPTRQRVAYGSLLVLVGAIVPLFAVGLGEYIHSRIAFGEILAYQQRAYFTLLVTHGLTLSVVNLLFLFRPAPHPVTTSSS